MRHRPRMRPTFEIALPEHEGAAFFARVGTELADSTAYEGQVLPGHAVLHLKPDRRTILSPFLAVDWDPDHGCLRGRFSPHPNVWMGFMAVYCLLGLVGLCGAMYGLAEWTLGDLHWSLVLAPVSLLAIAFVYGAAVIGQGLTADDMYGLRAFVDDAVRAVQDGEPE